MKNARPILIVFLFYILVLTSCTTVVLIRSTTKATLKDLPVLTVQNGGSSIQAESGTYSWSYNNIFGKVIEGIEVDTIHLLYWKHSTILNFNKNFLEVSFQFDVAPDSISIECWQEQYRRDNYEDKTPLPESEIVPVNSFSIKLKEDSYIYLVRAVWEKETYRGTVDYVFIACPTTV